MRKLLTTALSLLFAGMMLTGFAFAEPMSFIGNHDIGELMSVAEQTYTLADEDAVILFEGYREIMLPDGRVQEQYHEIVWISTDQAIDFYADLRVPFSKEHQTLTVESLRTWMDERWWDAGETAVVETLPGAVNHAYDYTDVRETMMLHDGVQLPCIMETVYTIEDKHPYREGIEGVFVFAQDDPAVRVNLTVGTPVGNPPQYRGAQGVSTPEITTDNDLHVDLYSWTVEPVDALPRPITVDPAAYMAHVSWSTWDNWEDFGNQINTWFELRMPLSDELKAELADVIDGAYTEQQKAQEIADYVAASTNYINWHDSFWMAFPRSATRTWNTAYGNTYDRAGLAAALFQEAGFMVWPAYLGNGYGAINEGVATIGRMADNFGVWVSGDGVEAFYNPANSSLSNGLSPIYGRAVWLPGSEDEPTVRWSGEGEPSHIAYDIDLYYCPVENKWYGNGVFTATGRACPFESMEGIGTEARDHIEEMVGGMFDGAELTSYNPTIFDRFTVTAGFAFNFDNCNQDYLERSSVVIGNPGGGVMDMLPHDVHIYNSERQSPVRVAGVFHQSVEVTIHPHDFEAVFVPEAIQVENEAGTAAIAVEQDEDTITITRTLEFAKTRFSAEEWPALRELLLTETMTKNRTVLLE